MKSVNAYSALALVYDMVMDHVDYEGWADYILHIVEEHSDKEDSSDLHILELGCGTGLFTAELMEQTKAFVSAADNSSHMLEWASKRLQSNERRVALHQLDFETGWDEFHTDRPVDVVILLYDCINYVRTEKGLGQLFEGVSRQMKPDSLFVFDQSTPSNSINNAEYFEDEGEQGNISYTRKSAFDVESRLHTTEFEIETPDGAFHENHVQRAWTRQEILHEIEKAGFSLIAAYDGFSLDDAHDESERIHWVLRKAN